MPFPANVPEKVSMTAAESRHLRPAGRNPGAGLIRMLNWRSMALDCAV